MNIQVRWDTAPAWANYIVMDSSGIWWWHSHRPDECVAVDAQVEHAPVAKCLVFSDAVEAHPELVTETTMSTTPP